MRKPLLLLFIAIFLSVILMNCTKKSQVTVQAPVILKIVEAYLQQEVPGQQNMPSYWKFSIQVEPSIPLHTVIFNDEEFRLIKSGSTWNTILNLKYSSEETLPKEGNLKFIYEGEFKIVRISKITVKEPLYLP
jgi:hypothetical protein